MYQCFSSNSYPTAFCELSSRNISLKEKTTKAGDLKEWGVRKWCLQIWPHGSNCHPVARGSWLDPPQSTMICRDTGPDSKQGTPAAPSSQSRSQKSEEISQCPDVPPISFALPYVHLTDVKGPCYTTCLLTKETEKDVLRQSVVLKVWVVTKL